MMFRKFVTILMVVMVLSLTIIAIPAMPAMAAPAVTVSPTAGDVGTFTVLTGTGFTAGAIYIVYFAYGTTFQTATNGLVAGDGSILQQLGIPAVPGGSYTIYVQNSTNPAEFATTTFVVTTSLSLNKSQAAVGEQVAITGNGYSASRLVTIYFDNVSIATNFTSNANGSLSATFTVPESTRGLHTVRVTDISFSDTASLTTIQSIKLNPTTGRVGSTVTISGTGFRASQTVTITYDGVTMTTNPATITTGSTGSFTATFSVPAGFVRSAAVVASDGVYSATANFTLQASITLSPTTGIVGSQVTITGNGFATSTNITIRLDSVQVSTTTSDAQGTFTTIVTIPPSSAGTHTITAQDSTNSATAEFKTQASISINPTRGPTGTQVTVTGAGFDPGKLVGLRFVNTQLKNTATDPSGSFSDTFVVPQVDAGNYSIIATDGTNSASVFFTVTVSISLNQNTGNVGSNLTISGKGFSGTVTIKYDNTAVATVSAGANGSFSATFSVPPSAHGEHTITVSDGTNTLRTTFTMESTPPPVPALLAPINMAKVNSQPAFDWTPVSDPSGVTYSLQIAKDAGFSSVVLQKQGLTSSEYALMRAERLSSTSVQAPYYWRVKAIDGASNESAWSTAATFYVSFIPDWAKFTLYGIGGVILLLLVFWVGMRTGMRRAKG